MLVPRAVIGPHIPFSAMLTTVPGRLGAGREELGSNPKPQWLSRPCRLDGPDEGPMAPTAADALATRAITAAAKPPKIRGRFRALISGLHRRSGWRPLGPPWIQVDLPVGQAAVEDLQRRLTLIAGRPAAAGGWQTRHQPDDQRDQDESQHAHAKPSERPIPPPPYRPIIVNSLVVCPVPPSYLHTDARVLRSCRGTTKKRCRSAANRLFAVRGDGAGSRRWDVEGSWPAGMGVVETSKDQRTTSRVRAYGFAA